MLINFAFRKVEHKNMESNLSRIVAEATEHKNDMLKRLASLESLYKETKAKAKREIEKAIASRIEDGMYRFVVDIMDIRKVSVRAERVRRSEPVYFVFEIGYDESFDVTKIEMSVRGSLPMVLYSAPGSKMTLTEVLSDKESLEGIAAVIRERMSEYARINRETNECSDACRKATTYAAKLRHSCEQLKCLRNVVCVLANSPDASEKYIIMINTCHMKSRMIDPVAATVKCVGHYGFPSYYGMGVICPRNESFISPQNEMTVRVGDVKFGNINLADMTESDVDAIESEVLMIASVE